MSEATLTLSEHELYFLPPGTPATAPATRVEVEVEGVKSWYLARFHWQYGRTKGGRQVYSVFYRTEQNEVILCGMASTHGDVEKLSQEKITELVQEIISARSLWRFWHPPNAICRIAFTPYGFGNVTWRDGELDIVNFRWEQPWQENEFSTYPQSAFLDFCEQFRRDENSELNYAFSWHDLTTEEKNSRAFRCENGDWEALRRLFSLVQSLLIYHGVLIPLRSGKSRWQFDLTRSLSRTQGHPWLIRWRTAICQIVCPSFWLNEPKCHTDWRHKVGNENRCKVVCTMPTAHEFLEAQLQLREFLRPHLPADEIEALFMPETSL